MRKRLFAYAKTKMQISFAVTAKLISAFVFATRIVQSLFFLNLKFQASSHFLWLYSPVCVGPGRKPEDGFSHNEALIFLIKEAALNLALVTTRLCLSMVDKFIKWIRIKHQFLLILRENQTCSMNQDQSKYTRSVQKVCGLLLECHFPLSESNKNW